MNLSAPFIRRPVATLLLSLAIILAGLVSFRLLSVAPLPNMDFPAIVVSASLPGASPQTMASSVATPLERALGSIAGISEMTSRSAQGNTRIIILFEIGRNVDAAAARGAGGDQRLAQPAAQRHAHHAHLREVQPVAGADHGAVADLAAAGQEPAVRPGLHGDRAEAVAGAGRGQDRDRRQLAAGRARAAGAAPARPVRRGPGRGAQRHRPGQPGSPQGRCRRCRPPLADPGQRPAAQGRAVPGPDHPLPEQRAGAPGRCGQGRGFGGEPLQLRLLQRREGRAAGGQPPAGRQHHPDHRGHPRRTAGPGGGDAGQRPAGCGHGPLAGDPRQPARSRAYPADRRGPGDHGGLPVPRPLARLADSGSGGTGVAGRHASR